MNFVDELRKKYLKPIPREDQTPTQLTLTTLASKPKIVYLCGPYSGVDHRVVERNIENARAIAVYLAAHQVQYICPHLNSAHFDTILPNVSYEFWMTMYLNILVRCDALLTINGWQRSEGATKEVALASDLDMPVFHDRRKLLRWYVGL